MQESTERTSAVATCGYINFLPPGEKRGYKITIFMDEPASWIIPWGKLLQEILAPFHDVDICFHKDNMRGGDLAFLLGCTKILPGKYLNKYRLNLVIHESNLPEGKGWSPLSWQILKGRNTIPVVLLEAVEELDAGAIYIKDAIEFNGTELLPELKAKQGRKTVEMVCRFLEKWPDLQVVEQVGTPTVYPKRTRKDDQLDVYKTIAEQFDHLRIVDNENYPAWFEYRGRKYVVKIEPMN